MLQWLMVFYLMPWLLTASGLLRDLISDSLAAGSISTRSQCICLLLR
nr:MAG TPA: hypothetical protein [Caudoviricetes sp.]